MEMFNSPGVVHLYQWSVYRVNWDMDEMKKKYDGGIETEYELSGQLRMDYRTSTISSGGDSTHYDCIVARLELCDSSLDGWLDEFDTEEYTLKRLSEMQMIKFFKQLASALSVVHKKSMIHRDISPNNIFVVHRMGSADLKIGDFGLCRYPETDDNHTCLSTYVGQRLYMSPEMAAENCYDCSTDIYSLGKVFLRLFVSTMEHYTEEERGKCVEEMFVAVDRGSRLDELVSDPRMIQLVTKMTALVAAGRPTAEAVRALLDELYPS